MEAATETVEVSETENRCARCHMFVDADLPNKSLPVILFHFWQHKIVCRFFYRDLKFNACVLNHTNNWFSIGFTTSPTTNGHFLGFLVTDKGAKRQDQEDGKTHKDFRGLFAHAGFWWFKLYLYVYFDGDGK